MSTPRDYAAILARTIVANAARTREERQAIYRRARRALSRADLPAEDFLTESSTLEAAIARVEAEASALDRFPDARESDVASELDFDPLSADAGDAPPPSSRIGTHRSVFIASCVALLAIVAAIAGFLLWPDTSPKPQAKAARTASQSRVAAAVKSPEGAAKQSAAYVSGRQLVYYRSTYPAGTIIISKSQHFLYLVRPDVVAVRYAMGVGSDCAKAVGLLLVSSKEDWSDGAVRLEVRGRWGLRSLALSDSGYRIHGTASTQNPREITIGCFPLRDDDIVDLYDRVPLGAKVVIN